MFKFVFPFFVYLGRAWVGFEVSILASNRAKRFCLRMLHSVLYSFYARQDTCNVCIVISGQTTLVAFCRLKSETEDFLSLSMFFRC